MKKTIKCNLSQESIKNTLSELKNIKKDLLQANNDICKLIADDCEDRMLSYHDSSLFMHDKAQDDHSVISKVISTSEGYKVMLIGPQVIYDEYGTGDKGLANPHPNHDRDGMNPYNSGITIGPDANGNHFWIYNNIITYGVPSGKFAYRAVRDIVDGEGEKIARKHIENIINK